MPTEPPSETARSVLLAVISADPDFLADIGAGIARTHVTIEHALAEPQRLLYDVAVLDARDRHQHLEAARLVAGARIALVVYGPPDDSEQSMRYLDFGADDYVSIRTRRTELEARIRSAARYATNLDDDWLFAGPVSISLSRQEVRRKGETLHLTPNEYRVLEALALHPGETVPHREIMARVWGPELLSAHHYLRVYVRQLREKLNDGESDKGSLVETIPGAGYRLNAHRGRPAQRSVG